MPVMRAFIAIDLPRPVEEKLGRLQGDLRRTQAPVSWVKSKSIHITLKFLGNIYPEQAPAIEKALEEIAAVRAPFPLRAGGCGAFPSMKQMRVIWVGLRGGSDPLLELQRQVEKAMAQLGFKAEDRPFKPHLTVGRVKGKNRLRPLQEALLEHGDFETEPFDVREIVLYKSDLKPEGAIYTPLFRAAFQNLT